MDFGKIVARARAILSTPRTEWPIIAAEPATPKGLFIDYILILAALPPIATFIKASLIGNGALGINIRTPIGAGIGMLILSYLLSLVVIYLIAVIINALAPSFGGQKDQTQALKAVAYSWTAYWVASIAYILPWIGWLIAIAGVVYSIYLLYLGLPHTMRCPPEKAGGYTAVSVVLGVVLTIITGVIVSVPFRASMMAAADRQAVSYDSNSSLGKLAAIGARAEAASKELDAAQKSGDVAAQQAAMAKMTHAAMGNDGNVQSVDAEQLRGMLPDSVLGWKRENAQAERTAAMGMQVTTARAQYGDGGEHHVDLEVTDTGTMKGMMSIATAMAPQQEQTTDTGYEKTYTENGHLVHESWDRQSKDGEFSVVVGQRFTVKANGHVDDMAQLKSAVAAVDLAKLESMKDVGVKKN